MDEIIIQDRTEVVFVLADGKRMIATIRRGALEISADRLDGELTIKPVSANRIAVTTDK